MTARLPFAARRDPCELAAPEPTLADVLAELRAMRSELACLRVPRLPAADFATLGHLLPAIRAAVGCRVFSFADLAEHAKLPTPEARALGAALGSPDAGATKRLGKLFARALGVHVDGLLVQHIGDDRGAAVWSIGVAFPAGKLTVPHDLPVAPRSNRGIGTNGKGA